MDKFLLADNPMNDDSNAVIVHTENPVSIIECLEGHLKQAEDSYYKFYSFINLQGEVENWTLLVQFLNTIETDYAKLPEIAARILDDSWEWYQSYMDWQDNEDDD
ncbi:hypothetical protein OCK74_15130 [Chitinophagaceae bacterium LB-8]|uniref:Uncharacterized protein n=1 Tax=Paraflavisolibacter caeni TaxID=2982496 RepID=A0A9X2XP49_9BACT|nr:hypothetical protein [Paraflavisolibacter caeni]MCU7550453.1 hypothetical protein [Paraflavisolibacter caeni]